MVRPVTQSLFGLIMLDLMPGSPAVMADFGLDGWGATEDRKLAAHRRYEALYYPIRAGEITVEQLDQALGNGPKLTLLVRHAPSNPHKEIVFKTAWDDLRDIDE